MIIESQLLRIKPGYSGVYRVHGTVRHDANDVPAAGVRVFLMRTTGNLLWREVVTDANGQYVFDNIASGAWWVIAKPKTASYYPDIVRVNAEPMP